MARVDVTPQLSLLHPQHALLIQKQEDPLKFAGYLAQPWERQAGESMAHLQ